MSHFTILLISALVCCSTPILADNPLLPGKGDTPRIFAIVNEYTGWGTILSVPRITLYEDGKILFVKGTIDDGFKIYTAQLSERIFSEIKKSVGPSKPFLALREGYNLAPDFFDLPSVEISIANGENRKTVSAYGFTPAKLLYGGKLNLPGHEKADTLPKEFERVYDELVSIDPQDAKEWIPQYTEVRLISWDYAEGKPIQWPKGWPDTKHHLAFKDGPGQFDTVDHCSIVLESEKLDALKKLLDTEYKQPVVIDGKKWAVSYQPVVPGLPFWSKIERRLAEHSKRQ